jgi:electron transport complex protein RnfC
LWPAPASKCAPTHTETHETHTTEREEYHTPMGLFLKGISLPSKVAPTPVEFIEVPPPPRVILPLLQHLGDPAEPTVSVGDTVRAGDLIAEATTETSLPLYASISGRVTALTDTLDCRGKELRAVVIEAEGTTSPPSRTETIPDFSSLSQEELLTRITQAAVVTKGPHPVSLARELGALMEPSTHLALSGRRVTRPLDTLLISALDPEPSLGVNRYLAGITSETLPAGIAALKALSGAERVLITIDRNLPPPTPLLTLAATDDEETTTIVRLNGRRYPVGLPVPLIKATLGREVPLPYGHPRDVGVLLCDLETATSVGTAVTTATPPLFTMLTVGGGAIGTTGIVKVPLGTTASALIDSLGGFTREPAKLIFGGPMTGMAHYTLDVPLTKEVTGLFALTEQELTVVGEYRECINCGRCVKVCPVNLVPGMLSMYCAKDRFPEAAREGLLTCIECGCCDYVCPSRRPMVHLFRHAKHQLVEPGAEERGI